MHLGVEQNAPARSGAGRRGDGWASLAPCLHASLPSGPRSSTCQSPHAARLPALSRCPRGSLTPFPPPLPEAPLSLPLSLQCPSSAAGRDPRGRLGCVAWGWGHLRPCPPFPPKNHAPNAGAGAAARQEGGRAAGALGRPGGAGQGGEGSGGPGDVCGEAGQGMRGALTMAAERRPGAVQGIAGLCAALPFKAPPPPGPGAEGGRGAGGSAGGGQSKAEGWGGGGQPGLSGERLPGAVPSPTRLWRQMAAACLCWNLPWWEDSIRCRAALAALNLFYSTWVWSMAQHSHLQAELLHPEALNPPLCAKVRSTI